MSFKVRSIQILAIAATFSMLACSGGGSSSPDTKAPPAKNPVQNPGQGDAQQNPAQSGQSNNALTKNFWCRSFNENNADHQLRVEFYNDGKLGLTQFQLTADGRGQQERHSDGSYNVQGANLVLTFDNQPSSHQMRLDPESPTGAPQLHIDSGAFDPCN